MRGLFSWRKTVQPQAGAESYAFESAIGNPVFFAFSGTPVQEPINPLQPPPAYYPAALGPLSGIGGLQYSFLYTQPLYVPQPLVQ